MWTNPLVLNVFRFVFLVLAQVIIFNGLNFMGFINPMVYVLFFYWFPIRANRPFFLTLGFSLGFIIDVFSDTMALHAMSGLTLAYSRPVVMRFCFGANYEFQGFTFKSTTRVQRITFLVVLILIHHFVFFTFEILSFSHIPLILKKILFTSIVTLLLSVLLSSLFATEYD